MAVSELPVLKNETEFISTFTAICQATLALEPCTPPAALSKSECHPFEPLNQKTQKT
jgi:hypothetical protein